MQVKTIRRRQTIEGTASITRKSTITAVELFAVKVEDIKPAIFLSPNHFLLSAGALVAAGNSLQLNIISL